MASYTGKVTTARLAAGSKSERVGVVLQTETGQIPVRLQGGNALQDPELDKLVGKSIACRGQMTGTTLIITDWQEAQDAPREASQKEP